MVGNFVWNGWHIFATGCKRLKLGLTRLMLTHPAVEKWRLVKLGVSQLSWWARHRNRHRQGLKDL